MANFPNPFPFSPLPGYRESSGQRSLRDADSVPQAWKKHRVTDFNLKQTQKAVQSLQSEVSRMRRRIVGGQVPQAQVLLPFNVSSAGGTVFNVQGGTVETRLICDLSTGPTSHFLSEIETTFTFDTTTVDIGAFPDTSDACEIYLQSVQDCTVPTEGPQFTLQAAFFINGGGTGSNGLYQSIYPVCLFEDNYTSYGAGSNGSALTINYPLAVVSRNGQMMQIQLGNIFGQNARWPLTFIGPYVANRWYYPSEVVYFDAGGGNSGLYCMTGGQGDGPADYAILGYDQSSTEFWTKITL
jgi:hypothetical protein